MTWVSELVSMKAILLSYFVECGLKRIPSKRSGYDEMSSNLISMVEFGSLIAAVGEQLFQKRKHPKQGRHDENAAIAILNIGRMDDGMKQQAQCVYKNMPLLTLDCFARIIAGRIDAGPPFSALFTLWLSMMAAVGLASLSACSRHFT